MANALIYVKAAYEAAMQKNGGKWPSRAQVAEAMKGSTVKTLTGSTQTRADNDGLVDQVVGVTVKTADQPFPVIGEMVRYKGESLMPPTAQDPIAWISTLKPEFATAAAETRKLQVGQPHLPRNTQRAPMISTIVPLLVDSLANAALIFFAAVGLTLVFSVLRVLNVAHGSFYSIGAYVAASAGLFIASRQLSPYLSFAALFFSAMLVAVVLGPLIERTLVRWTYGKSEAIQILVTFGLFLILEDLQRLVFGVQSFYEDTPMRLLGSSEIGGVIYLNYQIVLVALAVLVLVGLRLLIKRTRLGRLVTAVVADREMAQSVRNRHQPHLHSGFHARRLPRCSGRSVGDADFRRRPGARRRYHGAGLRSRRHRRPWPDRGSSARGTHRRFDPRARHLLPS